MIMHMRKISSRFGVSLMLILLLLSSGCSKVGLNPKEHSLTRDAVKNFANAVEKNDRSTIDRILCSNMKRETVNTTLDDLETDGRATFAEVLRSASYDKSKSTPDRDVYVLKTIVGGQPLEQLLYVNQIPNGLCIEVS